MADIFTLTMCTSQVVQYNNLYMRLFERSIDTIQDGINSAIHQTSVMSDARGQITKKLQITGGSSLSSWEGAYFFSENCTGGSRGPIFVEADLTPRFAGGGGGC